MSEKIMTLMKKLNTKALKNGDVPVSCVITLNDKIISYGYNRKYIDNNPIAHAEIITIQKASKKLKTNNLIDCCMYVTLEPCNMCKAVINEARIKKVYYILNSTKNINNTTIYEKMFVKNIEFEQELKAFFYDKR